jgi:nitrate/TMAO reductase-like tetraheme cytochrome c subunit
LNKSSRNKFLFISVLAFTAIVFYQAYFNKPEENIMPLTNSWEIAIANQEIPEGLTSLSAAECGACHQQHYKEWKLSTHAHAWTDLQFQAELEKESSPFMCINCHIPLQNQQEFIIEGLEDGDIYKPVKKENPLFDKALQLEGINCASCHVRDKVIIGPTGTTKAPHKTKKDLKFLSEELCISCHNAVAVITPVLACTFETGDEWKAGPFFESKNCISCHMESITREIVPGFGERPSRSHFFPGSGIPKFDTVQTNGLNGLAIYPSSLKKFYSQQDSLIFSLRLKNEFAGHNVPTGDPERHFTISFVLRNNAGDIISSKSDRIGEEWEWYPEAKKLSDNNLVPNEERVFNFKYMTKKAGQLTLTVNVSKHRLDKESADYNMLGDNYPLFISIFDKEYLIQVK